MKRVLFTLSIVGFTGSVAPAAAAFRIDCIFRCPVDASKCAARICFRCKQGAKAVEHSLGQTKEAVTSCCASCGEWLQDVYDGQPGMGLIYDGPEDQAQAIYDQWHGGRGKEE